VVLPIEDFSSPVHRVRGRRLAHPLVTDGMGRRPRARVVDRSSESPGNSWRWQQGFDRLRALRDEIAEGRSAQQAAIILCTACGRVPIALPFLVLSADESLNCCRKARVKKGRLLGFVAALLAALPSGAGAEPSCFSAEHTRARRLMKGNLDGDGVNDAVWVGARRQRGPCRFYVFVRTSTAGKSGVRLRAPDKLSRYSLRHNARPIALIRVDAIAGREIAVKLLQGASVRPFGFFTMRQGRLRRMGIQGKIAKPLAAEDMFAFGGGLSLMFATDCAYGKAPRTVVHSRAFPKSAIEGRYIVERRWYQVRGSDFVQTTHPVQKEVLRIRNIKRHFSEYRHGGLLAHCRGKVLDPRRA
jgi:hypothetical protein